TFTEIWAARENCTAGIPVFRSEATCSGSGQDCEGIIDGGGFPTVCCNNGSGDVRDALGSCTDADFGCIGVLSLDSFDNVLTDGNERARFIGIDGAYPDLCSVSEGAYDFVSLNTAQTIAGLTNALEPIITAVTSAADVAAANTSINDDVLPATGRSTGFMADPTNGNTPVATVCQELDNGASNDVIQNPTTRFTRASLGSPNNCQPYRSVFRFPLITLTGAAGGVAQPEAAPAPRRGRR
ncbi:MAG: hypothetical protein AAFX85_16025, partial [Pseudomonadota bacterium]